MSYTESQQSRELAANTHTHTHVNTHTTENCEERQLTADLMYNLTQLKH